MDIDGNELQFNDRQCVLNGELEVKEFLTHLLEIRPDMPASYLDLEVLRAWRATHSNLSDVGDSA